MVLTQQTSQASYYARLFLLLGIALLVLVLLLTAWEPYSRYRHAQSWIATEANVVAVSELCEVEAKVGKNWRTEATIPCADAERFIAEHRGVLKASWQTIPREFVRIAYQAGGEQRAQSVRRNLVAGAPVKAGERLSIVVDPANPMNVDRALAADDFAPVWRVAIGGLTMALLLTLVGWLGGRYNDRRAARAVAEK
jgi:hypothetical protein